MSTNVSVAYERLTQLEIEDARGYLECARDNVLAATEGLSEAQWNYRPANGGWPVAGLVEHMVIIQDLVLGPFAQALADSPAAPGVDAQQVDAIIKEQFPDRRLKFPAPEVVHPTGRWTPSESLKRLAENTERLIERLESTPGLRQHRVPSPPLSAITGGEHQMMDGYQWILAAAAHTERHTNQIVEVKSEPGFPAS